MSRPPVSTRSARPSPALRWVALVASLFLATAVARTAVADEPPPAPAEPAPATGAVPWMHKDLLFDVTFVGQHVWIVGYPGVIAHSRDGGRTWERQAAGTAEGLFSVDFVDERRGWIVGRRGIILHTQDGGATWARQKSGTAEPILAVDFVDERHGWAVGNFALILHTADGGATWAPQSLGPDEDAVLNDVSFVSPTEGWLAGEFGTIAHTTDGGATWERQETGVDKALFGLAFRQDRQGVAVGSVGTVLVTKDGGETWEARDLNVRDPLLDVHFGESFGWACGRGGNLVHRKDDGTLERVHAGVYVWLSAIAFEPGGTGLAVGRAGTVLRTTDGGVTWSPLPMDR